jgi:hypothetical protein
MNNCIRFSPRASLAITGIRIKQMGIWQTIEKYVRIKQKVIKYTPVEKLQDAFINIMAGGQGIVEVNNRVRPDVGLSAAFGRSGCADQSTVSETLNACSERTVKQMREAMRVIYQQHSQGYAHHYGREWQVLDADMSGMPAGRQGEKVTGGYFAKQKNQRGRQTGRVVATLYDEIVVERLYSGTTQLNRSLQELIRASETVLDLNPGFRKRTIVRTDGGGGTDADINWLLGRGYCILTKVTHWRRLEKLIPSVEGWHSDPNEPKRQAGWVTDPHQYDQPTKQLAVRCQQKNGQWREAVLVFNLTDDQLRWLLQHRYPPEALPADTMWLAVAAYDKRGGAAETTIKGSKSGLGLTKRNKKRFHAQEMLLLLAQLAYNLTAWTRNGLASVTARLRSFGMLRMVRDAFHIPGAITFDKYGHIVQVTLNQAYGLASSFVSALATYLARDGTVANLGEI